MGVSLKADLFRYWHTLRHLRPVQFYGRLWFHLYRPHPDHRPAPPLRPITGCWITPPPGESCLLGSHTFHFLNQTRTLVDPGDWNAPDIDKLWLYNLHYFDDLNATDAGKRQTWHCSLIDRWIAENPPGYGNGWEPYPLSLRIVNWIKWALAGHLLEQSWLHSLAVQVRFLRRRLEYHLLGNHLFTNAKALVFAGLFFQGQEADEWLDTGLALLRREVPEQVLADGGHFERSPMYHAILMQDLLDLLNLACTYGAAFPEPALIPAWREVAKRMRHWLATLCHPDGEISFFNDAAIGIAPTPQALEAYAGCLGLELTAAACGFGITRLAESGYIRLQQGSAVVLLDVAPVGPDYLPGHAHADTLSFEWSLFGQRVVVNSGTSCYGVSPERQRQRGTAAHNTVLIDSQDSSEIWGGFRVARRARALDLSVAEDNAVIEVRCAHDGYRRLRGHPLHRRWWRLDDETLTIRDRIEGSFREAVACLHFHPAISAGYHNENSGVLHLPDGHEVSWKITCGRGQLQKSTYHPRFGVSEANHCLVIHFCDAESEITFRWGQYAHSISV